MAQQLLHDAHVGSAVEQMGGKRMPQHVGRHRGGDAGALGGILKHLPRTLPRQPPAPRVEEDRGGAPAPSRQVGATAHQIGVQRRHGGPPDRDQALLATLAGQQHRPCRGVHIVEVEADRLGDAGAGRIQQLQQRPVAQRQRPVGVAVPARGLEQRQHLVERQALGQAPTRRRRLDLTGDVDRGDALGSGEAVQAAHGDDGPGGGHRGQGHHTVVGVAAPQRDEEVADVGLGDRSQVADAAATEMLAVAAQITPVRAQRVGRHAPLDREVVEITLELVLERPTHRQRGVAHRCPIRVENAVGRSVHGASTGRSDATSGITCAARMPATEMALTISPENTICTASDSGTLRTTRSASSS